MSKLRSAFRDDPAFIPYITAGDPDVEKSQKYINALAEGGADIIELGLPHSEPIADGATIQNAIVRSLESGMTPDVFFDLVNTVSVSAPLVCMTYYNIIYQYGSEEGVFPFVDKATDVGIDGIIVPDLPVEEATPLKKACDSANIDLVFIVAPTTNTDRISQILNQSTGFVYVQARLGTTGARKDISKQTFQILDRIPSTELPLAVGFGVSNGDQARQIIAAGADGVVAGSVFVDIIGSEQDVVAKLRKKTKELKEGVLSGQ
ncbi:MAG: tryptophan synthase subunit alpha [Halobacteriaceae archaeon]